MHLSVVAAFTYLAFMWGSTYLFIKIGLAYWPPFWFAAARNILAGLTAAAAVLALGRSWRRPWRALWPILVYALVNASAFGLIFWGEQFVPSGQAAVLVGTVPLFALFLGRWWLGEPITWARAGGVALGLAGVLLATGQRAGTGFAPSAGQVMMGQAALIGAALCYAVATVFAKRYVTGDRYVNTAIYLTTAGLVLVPVAAAWDPPPAAAAWSLPALGSLLYLAVPGSTLAYLCMFYLIEHLTPLQTSYVTLLNPVVGVLLGVAVLGEQLTPGALAGTALVLAGAWLVNRPVPAGLAGAQSQTRTGVKSRASHATSR